MKPINLLNKELLKIIKTLFKDLGEEFHEDYLRLVCFEKSDTSVHGDYSSSCALKLSKKLNKNPNEIAKIISDNFSVPWIKKCEVLGPGFFNVYLDSETKSKLLQGIIEEDQNYGKSEKNGKKILLEFVSSNPTGPLHVGHGRGAVLGIALSNLLENSGYEVTKEYYVNDAGRQISILTSSILLNAYVKEFEIEGIYEGNYIHELAKEFVSDQPKINVAIDFKQLSDETEEKLDQVSEYFQRNHSKHWVTAKDFIVKKILLLIKNELKSFNIIHDSWFHESSLGSIQDSNSSLAKSLSIIKNAGHTYSSEGAIWFKTTEFNDDKDRVLLRENGEPTYYLTDVGYHKHKIDREYDLYINIFGADHHGYIPRLTAAFDVLKKDKQDIEFMLYQLVHLYEDGNKKAMSTRKGEYYSLEELRTELGPDVIKFFFLEKKSDHAMDFDINLAKDESKNNPYFYAQYAHVRCCSILTKKSFEPSERFENKEIEKNFDIVSKLLNFPDLLEQYAEERSPHSLVHYIKDLAAAFHTFYEQNPVINEDSKIENARLLLTMTTKIVLANSFRILNVEPLEKM